MFRFFQRRNSAEGELSISQSTTKTLWRNILPHESSILENEISNEHKARYKRNRKSSNAATKRVQTKIAKTSLRATTQRYQPKHTKASTPSKRQRVDNRANTNKSIDKKTANKILPSSQFANDSLWVGDCDVLTPTSDDNSFTIFANLNTTNASNKENFSKKKNKKDLGHNVKDTLVTLFSPNEKSPDTELIMQLSKTLATKDRKVLSTNDPLKTVEDGCSQIRMQKPNRTIPDKSIPNNFISTNAKTNTRTVGMEPLTDSLGAMFLSATNPDEDSMVKSPQNKYKAIHSPDGLLMITHESNLPHNIRQLRRTHTSHTDKNDIKGRSRKRQYPDRQSNTLLARDTTAPILDIVTDCNSLNSLDSKTSAVILSDNFQFIQAVLTNKMMDTKGLILSPRKKLEESLQTHDGFTKSNKAAVDVGSQFDLELNNIAFLTDVAHTIQDSINQQYSDVLLGGCFHDVSFQALKEKKSSTSWSIEAHDNFFLGQSSKKRMKPTICLLSQVHEDSKGHDVSFPEADRNQAARIVSHLSPDVSNRKALQRNTTLEPHQCSEYKTLATPVQASLLKIPLNVEVSASIDMSPLTMTKETLTSPSIAYVDRESQIRNSIDPDGLCPSVICVSSTCDVSTVTHLSFLEESTAKVESNLCYRDKVHAVRQVGKTGGMEIDELYAENKGLRYTILQPEDVSKDKKEHFNQSCSSASNRDRQQTQGHATELNDANQCSLHETPEEGCLPRTVKQMPSSFQELMKASLLSPGLKSKAKATAMDIVLDQPFATEVDTIGYIDPVPVCHHSETQNEEKQIECCEQDDGLDTKTNIIFDLKNREKSSPLDKENWKNASTRLFEEKEVHVSHQLSPIFQKAAGETAIVNPTKEHNISVTAKSRRDRKHEGKQKKKTRTLNEIRVVDMCRSEKLLSDTIKPPTRSKRTRVPTNRYGFGINKLDTKNQTDDREGTTKIRSTRERLEEAQQDGNHNHNDLSCGDSEENKCNELLPKNADVETNLHNMELITETNLSHSDTKPAKIVYPIAELNETNTDGLMRRIANADDDIRRGALVSPPTDDHIESSNGRFVMEVVEVENPCAIERTHILPVEIPSLQCTQSSKVVKVVSTAARTTSQLRTSSKEVVLKQPDRTKDELIGVEKKPEFEVVDDGMNNKENEHEWSKQQLSQLKIARGHVNPTSEMFWFDVANMVDGKSESECRRKWFESCSHTKKPKILPVVTKQKTKKKGKVNSEIIHYDDDIFKATPMRKIIDDHTELLDMNIDDISPIHVLWSASNLLNKTNHNRQSMSTVDSSDTYKFIPYKRKDICPKYLQSLKRNCVQVSKVQAKKNKKQQQQQIVKKDKNNKTKKQTIAVAVRDGDIDLNAILSPSGRIEIKDRTELDNDDDDDFWNEMYDEENKDDD